MLKEGLKDVGWNVSSLADRVQFSRNKNNDADINHQLARDVANILFMERPVLAMCFRQHDDDNAGSLTASQLMELLMSNRLRTGLAGKPKLAKAISLEFFERAQKNPNTTDRMDFNEMVNTVSTILEEEKAEQHAQTDETFQVGTKEYGERRNEVRPPQTFHEHMNYKVNPPPTVPIVQRKPRTFARSQLMEESIARACWGSRSLSIMDVSDFKAAAIKVRHVYIRHVSRGSDAVQNYGELSCREDDVPRILFELGIFLNEAQTAYVVERCRVKEGEGAGMGAVEKRVVGSYVPCRNLVLFLAGIVSHLL